MTTDSGISVFRDGNPPRLEKASAAELVGSMQLAGSVSRNAFSKRGV